MSRVTTVVQTLVSFFVLTSLVACGGGSSSGSGTTQPLSDGNVNLIFVVTPDLAYNTAGDINLATANLTSQGLQRSLMMATYLKQQVLGGKKVTGIYTISPMSHLQTANSYPDMAAIGFIQQFALLNQITLHVDAPNGTSYTANNYPINVSYANAAGVPAGVAAPTTFGTSCSGLDFGNAAGINDTLTAGIIAVKAPGYYVFSAPWETVSAMLTKINSQYGYNLNLPSSYKGTNYIYAITIPSSGKAGLVTYNSNLTPPATYPVLPAEVPAAACRHDQQPYFRLVAYAGMAGVTVPATINKNLRLYIVRHAEAHPDDQTHNKFDDGNYVAAGQWRALALANALRGKIAPNAVYSIDPAGMWYPNYDREVSYVRPSLTILPYVIANNLPYYLAAGLSLGNPFNPAEVDAAQATRDFFFFPHTDGSSFSSQTLLVAWESGHIKPFINQLIKLYGSGLPLLDETWPVKDYDTIWTVTLDAQGNLTVDNELCEGIDSASLPATAPLY